MIEYEVIYQLNGIQNRHYVSINGNLQALTAKEIESSIIYQVKKDCGVSASDSFRIISIQKR